MKTFCKSLLPVALLALTLGSCTLSEPDESKNAGGRFESISALGFNYYSVEYDSSGRVTTINDRLSGIQISVSYSPLTIIQSELDSYYDGDKDVPYVSEETIMTKITLNGLGYVQSCDVEENRYTYSYSSFDEKYEISLVGTDNYHNTYNYDSEGHLLSSMAGDEPTILTWKNGLLTSMHNDDNAVYFEYGATDNKWLQWVPFWAVMGDLEMTNLFGKAPSKLITAVYEGSESELSMQFSYRMNSAGQISSIKFNDYGDILTFMFNYGK